MIKGSIKVMEVSDLSDEDKHTIIKGIPGTNLVVVANKTNTNQMETIKA